MSIVNVPRLFLLAGLVLVGVLGCEATAAPDGGGGGLDLQLVIDQAHLHPRPVGPTLPRQSAAVQRRFAQFFTGSAGPG